MSASIKSYRWVKWAILVACLAAVVVFAIPEIMNANAPTKPSSTQDSESQNRSESTNSYSDDDFALPDEAVITDAAADGIAGGLVSTNIFEPEPRVAEDELDGVTLGLPIAYYFFECDDSGTYAFNSSVGYELYPVYLNGNLNCLACYSNIFGLNGIIDYDSSEAGPDDFLPLYERLKAGTAGSVAVILAKDGTYLYDGSSFELVSEQGALDNYGVADDEDDSVWDAWHLASLSETDLPDGLAAGIRLTDTSVTEPIL